MWLCPDSAVTTMSAYTSAPLLLLSPTPLLLLSLATHVSQAYRQFQSLLPNGDSVLDPCVPQSFWPGLGHQSPRGGNDRNPFGRDFYSHGKVWSPELCQLDSDGDGLSNGQELGDPQCVWRPGQVPQGPSTSHPGVCEPVSSHKCAGRNLWLDCSKEVHNLQKPACESLQDPAVVTKDLRMSATPVPAQETTYFCQLFDLNLTSDLHMVATQPLIDAEEVVHHILMFGCDPRASLDADRRSPYLCDMVPDEGCRSLIGAWTMGSHGDCAHPDMGFRVGPGGYRTVALQVLIHWNNPKQSPNILDSSGLRLFMTSRLRKFDAGMLVIGQQFLQIDSAAAPSSREEASGVRFSATCPERCTQEMFKTPIYVTSAVNHMHYLGKAQEIRVYKNNSLVSTITDQHEYNYDDPVIYTFSEPIKINPGDEIRTICSYKKTTKSEPICWGHATSDEMCFGFITYFPHQSLSHPWCTSVKSFPSCERHLEGLQRQPVDDCRWWEFRNTSHPDSRRMMGQLFTTCYSDKSEKLVCSEECQATARMIADHPCLKGEAGGYMLDRFKQSEVGQKVLRAVLTCSCRHFSYCDRKTPEGLLGELDLCSSSSSWSRGTSLLLCLVVVFISSINS